MQIITEVINENKDKVKIRVSPYECYGDFKYKISLEITPYRKRKSFHLDFINDYNYRSLEYGSQARNDYAKEQVFKYVTEEQIRDALNKAYEALKPLSDNVLYT